MRPVEAGFWKLRETFDGTYTIDDLFDIVEMMDVTLENRFLASEWNTRGANGS
jgi:hypothetical protein